MNGDAGLNLQIDSPDLAMAAHSRSVGSSITSWDQHLPMAIEAINAALKGIPAERVRLHVCWGNYAGPHHCDVPFADIAGEVVKAKVGTIYPEGANPRREHEWRVFGDSRSGGRLAQARGDGPGRGAGDRGPVLAVEPQPLRVRPRPATLAATAVAWTASRSSASHRLAPTRSMAGTGRHPGEALTSGRRSFDGPGGVMSLVRRRGPLGRSRASRP
jgi:hypothetical protein